MFFSYILDYKNTFIGNLDNPYSNNWQNLRNFKKSFKSFDGSEIDFDLYDEELPLLLFYPSGESSGGHINIFFDTSFLIG